MLCQLLSTQVWTVTLLECKKQPGHIYRMESWRQIGCALAPRDPPASVWAHTGSQQPWDPGHASGLLTQGPPSPITGGLVLTRDLGRPPSGFQPALSNGWKRTPAADTERQLWTPRRGPCGSQPATRPEMEAPGQRWYVGSGPSQSHRADGVHVRLFPQNTLLLCWLPHPLGAPRTLPGKVIKKPNEIISRTWEIWSFKRATYIYKDEFVHSNQSLGFWAYGGDICRQGPLGGHRRQSRTARHRDRWHPICVTTQP